jgi:Holliday junction resolvasome RuvABC endonuclease subunit
VVEAFERGLEIFEYAPNELKSIIAGNGHASKKQI